MRRPPKIEVNTGRPLKADPSEYRKTIASGSQPSPLKYGDPNFVGYGPDPNNPGGKPIYHMMDPVSSGKKLRGPYVDPYATTPVESATIRRRNTGQLPSSTPIYRSGDILRMVQAQYLH